MTDGPKTRWEYAVVRPAPTPDMSGKEKWVQVVGVTFPTHKQAADARRRLPALRGVPPTICRRITSDWEKCDD